MLLSEMLLRRSRILKGPDGNALDFRLGSQPPPHGLDLHGLGLSSGSEEVGVELDKVLDVKCGGLGRPEFRWHEPTNFRQ